MCAEAIAVAAILAVTIASLCLREAVLDPEDVQAAVPDPPAVQAVGAVNSAGADQAAPACQVDVPAPVPVEAELAAVAKVLMSQPCWKGVHRESADVLQKAHHYANLLVIAGCPGCLCASCIICACPYVNGGMAVSHTA